MDKNKSKAIDRARKLMAMAADTSSLHEAAIAARRVRHIIDQYQLTTLDLREPQEYGTTTASKGRRKTPKWEQGLAISVANLNDCIVKYNKERALTFSGFEEDAAVCEFMLGYLVEHGLRMSKQHMKNFPDGNRQDFKMGYYRSLREKIKAMIAERNTLVTTETGTALVIVKKQLVEAHFGVVKYVRSSSRATRSSESYEEGQTTGRQTNVVTGVTQTHRHHLTN